MWHEVSGTPVSALAIDNAALRKVVNSSVL